MSRNSMGRCESFLIMFLLESDLDRFLSVDEINLKQSHSEAVRDALF